LSRSSGFWSMPQVRAFFVDWTSAVHEIHARGQCISALVDLNSGQVQNAEVAAYIAAATTGLYIPGDTVAMLVPTSLAKMQMRRILEPKVHEFFRSPSITKSGQASSPGVMTVAAKLRAWSDAVMTTEFCAAVRYRHGLDQGSAAPGRRRFYRHVSDRQATVAEAVFH
jgi:hypothetical protein